MSIALDRFLGAFWIELEYLLCGTCLDDDHAESVRNHVMELACDPRLLLGYDAAGVCLALALESCGFLLDLAHVGATRADAVAQQQAGMIRNTIRAAESPKLL